MRNSRYGAVTLLAVMLTTAGCYTAWEGKEPKSGYRENEGSFTDQAARTAFVEQRTDELMRQGLKKDDAVSRASSEWFSRASIATQSPTRKELARRAAEANFADYVRKSKREADGL